MYALTGSPFLHAALSLMYVLLISIRFSDVYQVYQPIASGTLTNSEAARTYINTCIFLLVTAG